MADINDLLKGKQAQKFLGKKKLRPWTVLETPASVEVNSSAEVEVEDLAQSPNAAPTPPAAPVSNASEPPSLDTHNSKIDDLNASLKNTDTIPTQSRHSTDTKKSVSGSIKTNSTDTVPTQIKESPEKKYRHNTDTNKSDTGNSRPHSTDTIPTQIDAVKLNIIEDNGLTSKNTDTVPTQNKKKTANESRHNTDTNKAISEGTKSHNTDTVPTQSAPVKEVSKKTKSPRSTDTIPAQSRHNTDTMPAQAVSVPAKVATQSRLKAGTIPAQYRHRADTIPTPNPTQNSRASLGSTDTNFASADELERQYQLLRGLKLQLMGFCCKSCIRQNSTRLKTTYEALANSTGISIGSIRTTAKRLRDSGLFKIHSPGKGPGAFVEIYIPESIIRFAARSLLDQPLSTDTIPTPNSPESRHNTDTQSDTNASSKLVSINSNNLLTREDRYEGFDEIDLSVIQHLGITRKHIQDIRNQRLDVERMQLEDFISRFAHYSSDGNNVRNVKNVPALFIRMVQLLARGQNPLADVETPEDRALKELLERQKRQREQRLRLEQELLDFEFECWLETRTQVERDQIVPPVFPMSSGSELQLKALKGHYLEEIWPTRRIELLQGAGGDGT